MITPSASVVTVTLNPWICKACTRRTHSTVKGCLVMCSSPMDYRELYQLRYMWYWLCRELLHALKVVDECDALLGCAVEFPWLTWSLEEL